MTKRTRTVLFTICVFFFFLVAPAIILYSQGYRFDFSPPAGGKRIVQTGAFYFKTFPRSSEVYLNGKLKKKTSGITGSSLIENLLPNTYQIEIKKDGYYSWQKNLEIKEKQVTEAKNIVLFPENPDFTLLATSTDEINNIVSEIGISATSSDEKKMIESNGYEIWVLFLEDQYGQPQKQAGEKTFLTRFSEKICQVLWLNNHYLIFTVGGKIRTSSSDGSENLDFSPCSKLKIAEIDDRNKINIVNLAEFKSPEIFWSKTDKKLYLLNEGNLYLSENLLP